MCIVFLLLVCLWQKIVMVFFAEKELFRLGVSRAGLGERGRRGPGVGDEETPASSSSRRWITIFFGFWGVWFFFKRGWVDDELCGKTFTSLQSNFCSRRAAGLSVLGSGRRALPAPASSTTGFPGAGGRQLVGTRGSACLPGVAAHPHPNFCQISEPLGPVSFERKSPERR